MIDNLSSAQGGTEKSSRGWQQSPPKSYPIPLPSGKRLHDLTLQNYYFQWVKQL